MAKPPFCSMYFQFLRTGESAITTKIALVDEDKYLVEHATRKGGRPSLLAKRHIFWPRIMQFRDRCQEIGVFSWSGIYDGIDNESPVSRWSFRLIFEEGVFSIEAQGKSEVPHGFDEFLEELYQLDLPRPKIITSSDEEKEKDPLDAFTSSPLYGKLSGGSHMSLADMSAYAAIDDRTKNVSHILSQIAASGQGGAFGDAMNAFKIQDFNQDELVSRCRDYYRSLSLQERSLLISQLSSIMGIDEAEARRMLEDFDDE